MYVLGQLREGELAVVRAAGWEAACQAWTCMDSMAADAVWVAARERAGSYAGGRLGSCDWGRQSSARGWLFGVPRGWERTVAVSAGGRKVRAALLAGVGSEGNAGEINHAQSVTATAAHHCDMSMGTAPAPAPARQRRLRAA